jgi:hypothetical protein
MSLHGAKTHNSITIYFTAVKTSKLTYDSGPENKKYEIRDT